MKEWTDSRGRDGIDVDGDGCGTASNYYYRRRAGIRRAWAA